jgi:hypothetical protein
MFLSDTDVWVLFLVLPLHGNPNMRSYYVQAKVFLSFLLLLSIFLVHLNMLLW